MAQNSRAGAFERPMNVEQIVKRAGDEAVDPQFSIQHYFRSADLMVKQANIYEHEGNEQMAYFLLYRHANLILDALLKHPQAKDRKAEQMWTQARKAVSKSLQKLELLKPKINKRYERYTERRSALAAQAKAQAALPTREDSLDGTMANMTIEAGGTRKERHRDDSPDRLDAAQHRDMAVQLANREIGRRSRRVERSREDLALPADDDDETQRLLQSSMTDVHRRVEHSTTKVPPRTSSRRLSSSKSYNYPKVSQSDRSSVDARGLPSFTSIKHQPREHQTSLPPPRPPKQAMAPELPSKVPITSPPLPSKTLPSPPPSPTPANQFLPSAYLENGTPLRTIFFPSGLRSSFLRIASANTRLNLETCGILCGTLLRNAFFITKLVIPEQTSTSDTCEMVNEEALHAYIDSQPGGVELMVLGWIHTHPTQTAFMSSRDLHTHCWYQVQLPESIAVVCAPSRDPDWGIFRLTDPPGMDAIKKCRLPGIFHPHEETCIFTDAKGRPGHVIEHEDLEFEAVDLR